MEVLGMAGKLLRNISPDKIENRDAEYYKQALDLSPGYSDWEAIMMDTVVGTVVRWVWFCRVGGDFYT